MEQLHDETSQKRQRKDGVYNLPMEVWLFENEFSGFFRLRSDVTLEESMRNGRLKNWKVTAVVVDIG